MRAIAFDDFGGPEVLKIVEVPEPHAGRGQVRIRVAAAGLLISDTFVRAGTWTKELGDDRPIIVGWDTAGVVDEVGPGADERFSVGDVVIALPNSYAGKGAQAEYVVTEAESVVHSPRDTSFVEAATLLLNGLTARLMIDALELAPGATIAVTGAAGSVGGFVVELAKSEGYRVVADAKPEDRDLVAGFGADVIVERGDGFAAAVIESVGKVDGLIDAADIGESVVAAVADGRTAVSARYREGITERGVHWKKVFTPDHRTDTKALEKIRDAAQNGLLTLRVDDTYLPQQAVEAYRRLERGGLRGRLIFTF